MQLTCERVGYMYPLTQVPGYLWHLARQGRGVDCNQGVWVVIRTRKPASHRVEADWDKRKGAHTWCVDFLVQLSFVLPRLRYYHQGTELNSYQFYYTTTHRKRNRVNLPATTHASGMSWHSIGIVLIISVNPAKLLPENSHSIALDICPAITNQSDSSW